MLLLDRMCSIFTDKTVNCICSLITLTLLSHQALNTQSGGNVYITLLSIISTVGGELVLYIQKA